MSVTRRGFLQQAGIATLALSLGHLAPARSGRAASAETRTDPSAPSSTANEATYRTWSDLYREKLEWDHVAKGTHHVNCWYQRGCTWNVFVKDGLVLREEQAATYPQTNDFVPDFNPRGCQKGACYSDRMYDPGRMQHPLKRAGERGDGRWKRVSWQEALDDIADHVIDVMRKEGTRAVYWDLGGGMTNGAAMSGVVRTTRLLDSSILDLDSEVGDHHPGAAVTCGKIVFCSSGDDCFYSDLIINWGGNPAFTQIPNAHFINEARYHGARVVSITPDLSASGIHTDLWVPVNVGSDAALGLSLAQVILEEELHDEAFIREQTDLPLLVRRDTRRFLRASDLEEDGKEDEFFVFDLASDGPRAVEKETLALEGLQPALEGDFQLATRQGSVTVTPVLSLLREHLKSYTPELAAKVTGTCPKLIRSLARQIAKARAATMVSQSNFGKFYHGMEMERAQFLVFALCGQFGRKGAGLNAFPYLSIDANMLVAIAPPPLPDLGALIRAVMDGMRPMRGETTEMFYLRMSREMYKAGAFVSSSLFLHTHAGLAPLTGSSRRWDPHLEREADEYLSEAFEKGWQMPPPEPRMLFEVGGNLLRRARGHDRLREGLLPKLSMLVTFDWRFSTTALHSDYVLPAAGWYERDDIVWATPIAPFAQATTKAVEPVAEAKPDWEFHCLLMKAIQQRAIARGEETFTTHAGDEQSLDNVFDNFTFRGLVPEDDPEPLLKAILFASSNIEGTNWDKLKQQGHARLTGLGRNPFNITNATDIEPDQTITANTWHTENKMPWPTLTRRMQFYIDHDFYLELGEELPTHKDAPAIGGDHPLQMTSGHARWSIHSMWRDHRLMLDLQRGEPMVLLNQRDAESRSIRDGDRVRVRNDIGAFELLAKLSPTIRPGQIVVYHAWEPFQFPNHRSYQAVTPSPLNPIQMAGGYYHLQPHLTVGQPGMHDRGTRVEVEKI